MKNRIPSFGFFSNSVFKILIMVILAFAPLSSCIDLEEESFSDISDDNFFKTEEDFISALGVAYLSLYAYMETNSILAAQEVTSDALVVPTRGADWGSAHWVKLHRHTWDFEDPVIHFTWDFLFRGVNNCNRLIAQFEELDSPLVPPFIAEMRALRAIYYLWLLDAYGNVPILSSFADVASDPVNADREEVYNFVESELLETLELVKPNVDGTTYGRMNQMVIHMALAKLYLNAEIYTGTPQWEKAITQCNVIINSGNYALEADYFSNFNVNNENSSEFIFAIPYDEQFAGGFVIGMQSLSYFNQQTYDLQVQPWNGFCSLEDFYNSYEDSDLRKGKPNTEDGPSNVRGNFLVGPQWDISGKTRIEDPGYEQTDLDGAPLTLRPQINELFPNAWREAGARIAKFEYEIGGGPNMNNDFPIYRYSDVLLMKAEALWRMNAGDVQALDLVNQIRTRAGVTPFTELTAENFLAERGREMFVECHRRTDMIRFGVFGDEWWEKPPSDQTREIFPIPRRQMEENPNLVQNPGY